MANNCKIIFGLLFLALAFAVVKIGEQIQLSWVKQKAVFDLGKLSCKDIDLDDLTPADITADSCVSFKTDYNIAQNLCADDVLKEQLCAKAMMIRQRITMYQKFEKEVCSNKRTGAPFEADEDIEEAKASGRAQCTTETKYEWDHKKSPDSSKTFHFPTSDNAAIGYDNQGWRQFKNSANNSYFATDTATYKVRLSNIAYNEGLRQAGGPVAMDVWPVENFYETGVANRADAAELCIEYSEATSWALDYANDNDGLTNAQFTNGLNYGKEADYPRCEKTYPAMPVGTYKIVAEKRGGEQENLRIIGTLGANGFTNNEATVDGWKPDGSGSTGPHLFIWAPNEPETTTAITEESTRQEQAVGNLLKTMRNISNVLGAIGAIFIVLGLIAKDDKGSSSSSSS